MQVSLVWIFLQGIFQLGQELKFKSLDVWQEELGVVVDKEMVVIFVVIEDVVWRIEDMMNQVCYVSLGVKLEVNERIFNFLYRFDEGYLVFGDDIYQFVEGDCGEWQGGSYVVGILC